VVPVGPEEKVGMAVRAEAAQAVEVE